MEKKLISSITANDNQLRVIDELGAIWKTISNIFKQITYNHAKEH